MGGITPYTPLPWDWTRVRQRVAHMDEHHIHHLDVAVADIRCHLHVAGIRRIDTEHAEAMWIGARLAIANLLAALEDTVVDTDPEVQAHLEVHIDIVEELCCAARDLWPTRSARPSRSARLPDPPAGPAGFHPER